MRLYDEIASSVLKALYNMPPTTGCFVENFRCITPFNSQYQTFTQATALHVNCYIKVL